MNGRIFGFILTILVFVYTSMGAANAMASSQPSFPSCVNQATGEVLASYTDGIHGVPGDSTTYTGEDAVYKIDQDVVMQCLCPTDGDGIQTNWWKVSNLSENEIKVYQNQGWNYIPNGSAWGLETSAYLAKNIEYSCKAPEGQKGGGTPPSPYGDGKSDGQIGSLGNLTAPSQAVLGFAFTGNAIVIVSLIAMGVGLIGFGVAINEKKSK